MVASGAKGSKPNLLQIMANISQVTINGSRIDEQFGFRRTLPYFPRFATSPFAYGYVANSYVSGMTSPEYIFGGMNGRFDLINKALSTSITGAFMRIGMLNMMSAFIDNFRRVMNNDRVIQMLYGENGVDTRCLSPVRLPTVALSDTELRAKYHVDVAALVSSGVLLSTGGHDNAANAARTQDMVDAAVKELVADRDAYRAAFIRIENCTFGKPMTDEVMLPVNIRELINDVRIAERRVRGALPVRIATMPASAARAKQDGQTAGGTVDALRDRIFRVAELVLVFPYLLLNEFQEQKRSKYPLYLYAATTLMRMQIRSELSPAVLATLTNAQLTFIIDSIRHGYVTSLISYGVSAGSRAVQAISEPLTQYMLDSHHRSVAGGTNKSGIQRVHEIYGAVPVESEQSPSMLLRVLRDEHDQAKVQSVANNIEYLTFGRFARQYHILYEPVGELRYPPFAGDRAWMDEFRVNHPLLAPPHDLTNWCYRLVLDRSNMVLKGVSLETLAERMRAERPHTYIVYTPESAAVIAMRVYLRAGAFQRKNLRGSIEDQVKSLYEDILVTPIRGILGIQMALVETIKRHRVGDDNKLELDTLYAIRTVGTNIAGAMLNSAIDARRIISSSVGDTNKMFGLTAARNKIISETSSFVEATSRSHITLYADEMTRVGKVTPLERGGLAVREKNNILQRMALGDPIRTISEAVCNSTVGPVYGIAAPRVLGSTPEIGTRWNKLVVDESFVQKNMVSIDRVLDTL
jgi:hypothetical protein